MNEAKSHITSFSDTHMQFHSAGLGAPCSLRSGHRQHMTKRCRRPTSDKWPFHDEIFIEDCGLETLNFSHLHRRLFLLLLALGPPSHNALRSPQTPPASAWTRPTAPFGKPKKSLQLLLAIFSFYFISLAATVNMYFQGMNILMTCC